MQQQNIFDELYTDTKTEAIEGVDGLSELIYQTERKAPLVDEMIENNLIPYPLMQRPAKKKVTYYLSEKVVVELCEAKAKIRVMVPTGMKARVSMSRIVDYAVNAILDEFNTIGENSGLVRRIMTDK
jgi:hypothetical protein